MDRYSTTFSSKVMSVATVGLVLLCAVVTPGQQRSKTSNWANYSPTRASFCMRVPSVPTATSDHLFDPVDNNVAYRVIEKGLRSRTYNFEINKNDRTSFLVSILEVRTSKSRAHDFITDAEIEAIESVIGDDVVHSKVIRQATQNGERSQWTYNRKASVDADNDDDGVAYVRRWGTIVVIVVVDFIYAKAGDVDVDTMLDSLSLCRAT